MQQGDEGRSTPAHHVLAKTKTRLVSLCQVHAGGEEGIRVGTGRKFCLRVGPGFFDPCTGRAGPARGPRIYGPKFRLRAKSRGKLVFK